MEQGQNSGAYNSHIIEMEEMLKTPATATTIEIICPDGSKTPDGTEVDTPACLISWVDHNDKPDKVHIGPLHLLNPSHWMEKEKKKPLCVLLDHHRPRHRKELRRYLTAMESLECRARRCYDRTFSWMTSEAFARMLLLDGYFLYSHFVATTDTPVASTDITVVRETTDTPVASTDITVVRDVVFLLENQIPFFVLEEIHKLITDGADSDNSASVVVGRVARHVETLVQRHDYSTFTLDPVCARPCHLLHLLYMYFLPTALGAAKEVQLTVHSNATPLIPARWRAATYYYVAGVRLVKRELDGREARSILDVELTGGKLHVPCLMVDSNTLRMLRNMVELEQRNPRLGSHVTAYCVFMSQIANSGKDVALLVTKDIIVHFLHSEEDVATGLAKLCDGVILNIYDPKLNYLKPKQDALEKLCRDGWRKAMAWLRHSKCSNYLMALGVVAAFVVFICTVEQSMLAALSYASGRN